MIAHSLKLQFSSKKILIQFDGRDEEKERERERESQSRKSTETVALKQRNRESMQFTIGKGSLLIHLNRSKIDKLDFALTFTSISSAKSTMNDFLQHKVTRIHL